MTGVILVGIIDAIHSPCRYLEIVKTYQGLIAGLIAFTGAALTAFLLYLQLIREKQRRLASALAALPAHLSSLHGYTDDCLLLGNKLYRLLNRSAGTKLDPDDIPEPPEFDRATYLDLSKIVADLDDEHAMNVVAVLHWHQIQHSRISTLVKQCKEQSINNMVHVVTKHHAESAMRDAARLQLMMEPLYGLARGEMDHTQEISDEAIANRLQMRLGDYK